MSGCHVDRMRDALVKVPGLEFHFPLALLLEIEDLGLETLFRQFFRHAHLLCSTALIYGFLYT